VEGYPAGTGRARRGLSGRAPLAFAGGANGASKVEDTIIASRGPTMIVAGIDPGIHGGLAIVAVADGAALQLLDPPFRSRCRSAAGEVRQAADGGGWSLR
jgi:hypothetical protein